MFCEEFKQWVVEDKFPSGRPALDRVGVTFTSDVAPYEFMKIRILNGGHAAIAYPAGLLDIHFVHEAMEDSADRGVPRNADQARDHSRRAAAANRSDLEAYRRMVAARFANPKIGDTISRLCFDGSNRQPKFILPAARDRLKAGAGVNGLALVLGALVPLLLWRNGERKDDPSERPELGAPASGGQAGAKRSEGVARHGATSSAISRPNAAYVSDLLLGAVLVVGARAFGRRWPTICRISGERRRSLTTKTGAATERDAGNAIMKLKDKVALVTGGARGIGGCDRRALCRRGRTGGRRRHRDRPGAGNRHPPRRQGLRRRSSTSRKTASIDGCGRERR